MDNKRASTTEHISFEHARGSVASPIPEVDEEVKNENGVLTANNISPSMEWMMQRSVDERLERLHALQSALISNKSTASNDGRSGSDSDVKYFDVTRDESRDDRGRQMLWDLKATEEVAQVIQVLRKHPRPPLHFIIGPRDHRTQIAYHGWEGAGQDNSGTTNRKNGIKCLVVMVILNQAYLARSAYILTKKFPWLDVYAVYPRGFGPSSGKRGYGLTQDEFIEDVQAFLDHLAHNRPGLPIVLAGYEFACPLPLRLILSRNNQRNVNNNQGGVVQAFAAINLYFPGATRRGLGGTINSLHATISPLKALLAKWTHGACCGSATVIRVETQDPVYAFMPNFSGRITGNLFGLLLSRHPERKLKKLGIPWLLIYGEMDASVDYKKAAARFRPLLETSKKDDNKSKMVVVDGASMVSMSQACWIPLGNWIATLDLKEYPARREENHFFDERHLYALHGRTKLAVQTGPEEWVEVGLLSASPDQPVNSIICTFVVFTEHVCDDDDVLYKQLAEECRIQVVLVKNAPFLTQTSLGHILRYVRANWTAVPMVVGGMHKAGSLLLQTLMDSREQLEWHGVFLQTDGIPSFWPQLKSPFLLLLPSGHPPQTEDGALTDGQLRRIEYGALIDRNLLASWISGVASLASGRSVASHALGKTGKQEPLTLDDFDTVEVLGAGSFGKVWLVKHNDSNAFFALKVLSKETLTAKHQDQAVKSERDVLAEAGAQHPFIVPYIGCFQDRTRIFLLMDFVLGGEVYEVIQRRGPLPESWAKFYFAEVLSAVGYLHGKGIVYRDLKSENILLDSMGHVRLVDFGFAKRTNQTTLPNSSIGSNALADKNECTPIECLKTFCGSPFYLPPEIILGRSKEPYAMSCDWWSAGVWLYEMLSGGRMPFEGATQRAIYQSILTTEPDWDLLKNRKSRLGSNNSGDAAIENVSEECLGLLRWLLTKDPGRRPTSAGIRSHPWFTGMDWARLESRALTPPYQPPFAFAGDTSNFSAASTGRFAKDRLIPMEPLDNTYGTLFDTF